MVRRRRRRQQIEARTAGDGTSGTPEMETSRPGHPSASPGRQMPGVATSAPVAGPTTHFNARRLEDVGDVVLAVTRMFDPVAMAPERLELRAFRADAPGRGSLATAGPERLVSSEGGLAWVGIDLSCERTEFPWMEPAARVARIERMLVHGSTPAERAVHAVNGIADWLCSTWELELAFGTWYAVRGDGRAFDEGGGLLRADDPDRTLHTGDFGTWAAAWLTRREHAVTTEHPGAFQKVLNPMLHAHIADGRMG